MTPTPEFLDQACESVDPPAGAKKPLYFDYYFQFEDGTTHRVDLRLDWSSLTYLPQNKPEGSAWTRLDSYQCENCPLDPRVTTDCPVALNLKGLLDRFQSKISHEVVEVRVNTSERDYFKKTTLQKALSSIMGVLMVSSGCPILDKLRPMVRFHLPFATALETAFRTTGTYLLGQFFLQKKGKAPDYSLQGLVDIYRNIRTVNKAMADRINSVATEDAGINALVILDFFAVGIPLTVDAEIKGLESIFRPHDGPEKPHPPALDHG